MNVNMMNEGKFLVIVSVSVYVTEGSAIGLVGGLHSPRAPFSLKYIFFGRESGLQLESAAAVNPNCPQLPSFVKERTLSGVSDTEKTARLPSCYSPQDQHFHFRHSLSCQTADCNLDLLHFHFHIVACHQKWKSTPYFVLVCRRGGSSVT